MEKTVERMHSGTSVDNTDELLSEDECKEIRNLLSKLFTKYLKGKCIGPDCNNQRGPLNHIFSENHIRFYEPDEKKLQYIKKDMYEVLFPPSEGRNVFRSFPINKEPTFAGFCKNCDQKLFEDIDNYRHSSGQEIPDKVLFQIHYRIICNGLICLERERIIVNGFLEYFKKKGWVKQSNLYESFLEQTEICHRLHIEEKIQCERYIINDREAPKMERVFLFGDKLNPLCFGRLGYYAYQFSYSQKMVLSDFFSNMPYVTFFSIVGENSESHLVFTVLPDNVDHLLVVNKILDRLNPLNEIAHLMYIFSDGCILRDDHLEKHQEALSISINYFIENSGLYDFPI